MHTEIHVSVPITQILDLFSYAMLSSIELIWRVATFEKIALRVILMVW